MDAGQFDHWTRALAAVKTRRALGSLLGAAAIGAGQMGCLAAESAARKKRKRRKKKACSRCTACQTCVNGKCQNKPNGTICGSACPACAFGVCGERACVGNDCLPNQTCANECDEVLQDCANHCLCTAGVGGLTYCTVDPRPSCAGLTTCTSIASCPSGFLCQECDGANRCVPLCPLL